MQDSTPKKSMSEGNEGFGVHRQNRRKTFPKFSPNTMGNPLHDLPLPVSVTTPSQMLLDKVIESFIYCCCCYKSNMIGL